MASSKTGRTLAVVLAASAWLVVSPAAAQWPMLGANAQRTSSVPDEVRGNLRPLWYRPIEPYINYKVQVIAADGKLFIATARGLYCLNADTGAILWIYPTEVPLGHSPTYANGRVYVGSYDRTIHSIDAQTGQRSAGWTPHVALAGYETNPLVINGRIYAGNRDGYFYCLDATTGALIWRYKTGAAIRNSAAMDGARVIYFASEDLHAYALEDLGGSPRLVWRSAKLLGDTFATYWPVVYRNWVMFSGGAAYFTKPPYGDGRQLPWDEKDDINADISQATGNEPGDWAPGTVTMDANPIVQYFENKPHRRRVFMLNRSDGREYTYDSDGDGRTEYAPFTFTGITQSGAKYPPVVGNDGVLYTDVDIVATRNFWTPTGALVGWKLGTRFVSRVMEWQKHAQAADEPMAFSIGGRLAYWNLCCDRESGAFDLSIPFGQPNRWWQYFGYAGRFSFLPNYQPMYFNDDENGWGVYGDPRGVYGKHGAQNPWVPYAGKIYRQMGNTIVALAPSGGASSPLPLARTVAAPGAIPLPTLGELKARLEEEIQKMIAAGHLKPGLWASNIGDFTLNGNGRSLMDQGLYYFSNPGDTIYTLVRALPHLSAGLQSQARAYIQSEMTAFPIDTYAYIGHAEGASRQAATLPPEHAPEYAAIGKQTAVYNNTPWLFPMTAYYAAWKYARLYPQEASRLYDRMRPKITVPCPFSNAELLSSTHMLNAYIAGYRGYLELEAMAGRPVSANVNTEYQRLLALRVNNFSIDAPWQGYDAGGFDFLKSFIVARHFLYLVPELADELRRSKLAEVQQALAWINRVTPYWFVAGYDSTWAEGVHQHLYDVGTFSAYAMILQSPSSELLKYLDAPAFPVGDLFYIQNLSSVLDAASRDSATPPSAPTGVRVNPRTQ